MKPQGLTIIELFTTIIVMVSLFLAFVSLFYALDNYSKKSYRLLAASDEAYNKLLGYTEERAASLPTDTRNRSVVLEDFSDQLPVVIPEPRTATVTLSPITDAPQLGKLDVTINYPEGRSTNSVHYSKILYIRGASAWKE